MKQYRTTDGQRFNDLDSAVIHQQILDYLKQGLDITGYPYKYGEIEVLES